MRYSKQKEVVKDVVSRHRDHPSADDLYYEIREMIPNISLGTVYRNLERLVSKGQLKKIDTPFGGKRYDPDMEAHYHFFCLNCGKVEDVPKGYDFPDLKEALSWRGKRIITSIELSFRGYCEDCAENLPSVRS